MLAKNTNLGKRAVFDLSENLLSIKILVPLDEEVPVFGGKTLKVTSGMVLAYSGGKPTVALKGVSLMGVPLPNAWLGGIKNMDLVKEFGDSSGFWKVFSDGVEDIEVRQGRVQIRLRE